MRDTAASRRSSSKLAAEEEVELRRGRGELSCAECKRLKLKCDKKLPCSTCVRRGCQTVCPYGSLKNDQGSRFILADTDGLHQKISEMSQRIRQLEDALGLLQSSLSSEKHPLLRHDLLLIKYGPEKRLSSESDFTEDPLAEPVEAFGTLAIGDGGESRYFGASAGSETLLSAESEPEDYPSREQVMPELLNNLAAMFPVGSRCPTGPKTFENAMSMLLLCLPDRSRAMTLCETYLDQASWLFRPLKREELTQDIMNSIYAAKEEHEENPQLEFNSIVSPHKLSILYSIFALASIVDLTRPAFEEEGAYYHHCSRAALALRSIFDSPMVETVQAILFMAYYCSNSYQRYKRDSVWILVSLGSKVAQSVSEFIASSRTFTLLTDNARLECIATLRDGILMQQWLNGGGFFFGRFIRRTYFMCVLHYACAHSTYLSNRKSLALGRPPSIEMSYVDCGLPQAQGDSDIEQQLWNWKYQFTRNIFGSVLELTLGAKSTDYKAILEVDRKVRETPMPPALDVFTASDRDTRSLNVYMKGGYLAMIHSITMLYIHKNFFARALVDHPADPLASPYATSFLASAKSASVLIRYAATHISRFPDYCLRWWNLWVHIFSAAMIVGSIVTKAPSSSTAPAAFAELGIAVDLFDHGAKSSQRIKAGQNILHRLREKASILFALHGNGAKYPDAIPVMHGQDQYIDIDALAIVSGLARRPITQGSSNGMTDKSDASHQPPASTTVSSSIYGPSVEAASRSAASNMGAHNTHPFLLEELSLSRSTTFRDSDGFSDQVATGVSEPFSSRPEARSSDFSSFKIPGGPTSECLQSQYSSTQVLYGSNSTDPFEQIYTETLGENTWGIDDIDLGQPGSAINTGNGGDDDWMVFMKESGLV